MKVKLGAPAGTVGSSMEPEDNIMLIVMSLAVVALILVVWAV